MPIKHKADNASFNIGYVPLGLLKKGRHGIWSICKGKFLQAMEYCEEIWIPGSGFVKIPARPYDLF
jgi:hypothetical protein